MKLKKTLTLLACILTVYAFSQSISQRNYNVSGGSPTNHDTPGRILFPTGYSNHSTKTPVIFVHGITGKLSGSYDANIEQVKSRNLKAAFVQLKPLGSTIENGKLLSKMINYVRWHYNTETVSIVAHSKGGMDTERALYGQNAYYNYSRPSFSYEDVDGVYTFSSPVRGARLADTGATLSWFSNVVWATMWYTNGWSLTSGHVNGFHNWARGWRINSTSTFKNASNPNGASYSRINMSQDNTTKWWAHQSNDECYDNIWYYCYVGRPLHHSIGAYMDAYWEWDWFNSGWRNWHSNSDGFISEYRAKRYANQNSHPRLTPGAGDSNYRTIRDANHTSLWVSGENHFSREVAGYLHAGLYNGGHWSRPTNNNTSPNRQETKKEVEVHNSSILASSGNLYFAKDGKTNFIVEENNNPLNFIIYGDQKIENFILVNQKSGKEFIIEVTHSQKDDFSSAIINVANTSELEKGNYILKSDIKDFLVIANNEKTSTAFAVNLNFNEETGYNGETIEVAIANKDNAIDFEHVSVTADLTKVANNQDDTIAMGKTIKQHFSLSPSTKKGFYNIEFENLAPGSIYSLRIEATSTKGDVLLSRNIVNTFYVKKDIEIKPVSVVVAKNDTKQSRAINQINVYPNPATNNVVISNIAKNNINTIKLVDGKGNLIKEFKVSNTQLNIDLKAMNLPKGLYILKVETDKKTTTKKLVIE